MSTAQQILLSTVEYEVLWSHLELGSMPYPLGVPSVGFHPEERDRAVAEAWESLAERGLADGTRIDGDVLDLLHLLARPAISVDAVGDTGKPLRALAVSTGDSAVAAMLTRAGLTLTTIRPTALAGTLVGFLPYAEPGPGRAFAFPYQALREAMSDEDDDEDVFFGGDEHDALTRSGLAGTDARMLAELVDRRVRGGQFGITSWDRTRGDKVRHPTLVTWFDTDAGRYLAVRDNDWVSVAPAGADRIVARIDQALTAVRVDR